jgi:hypothetical protein
MRKMLLARRRFWRVIMSIMILMRMFSRPRGRCHIGRSTVYTACTHDSGTWDCKTPTLMTSSECLIEPVYRPTFGGDRRCYGFE